MKKTLKNNKGFSLVELLIALLIMAVIAGTAITLFGGVLETSKVGADKETAESIKRAILTYMNASNDINLSALGMADSSDDAALISALAQKIVISDTGSTVGATVISTHEVNDQTGEYGPFLESSTIQPKQNGKTGWDIDIDPSTMIITVVAAENGSLYIGTPATP